MYVWLFLDSSTCSIWIVRFFFIIVFETPMTGNENPSLSISLSSKNRGVFREFRNFCLFKGFHDWDEPLRARAAGDLALMSSADGHGLRARKLKRRPASEHKVWHAEQKVGHSELKVRFLKIKLAFWTLSWLSDLFVGLLILTIR